MPRSAAFIHGEAPALEPVLRGSGLAAIDVDGDQGMLDRDRLRPCDDFWDKLAQVMRHLRPADAAIATGQRAARQPRILT